jgi:hypothetical protein
MLRAQRLVPRLSARLQRAVVWAAGRRRFVHWAFDHYLEIAPPSYAREHARVPERARLPAAA